MLSSLFNGGAWLLDNWWYFHLAALACSLVWVLFGKGNFKSVAKFFTLSSLFAVTIVMISTFFPFIGGKDYFFRVSIEFALIFYIFWWMFESKIGEAVSEVKKLFSMPLFVAASAFVLMFVLASIFALDPMAGFWSNFERGEGGFQMLHYYGLLFLLVLLFKTEEDWKKVFKVSLSAATLMIFYGIIANLGLAENFINPYNGSPPSSVWSALSDARFQGSLGNPAYVAPYLLFSIFYTVYLWLGSKAVQLKKILIYGGLVLFFTLFFFLGQTRATFIGLGFGVVALLVYIIFSLPSLRKWFVAVLLAVLLLGGLGFYYKDSQFIKSLPGGRVFNVSLKTQELNTRFWTWGSAWQGFLERPILGWGPENFSAVFDKYFDTRHYVPGRQTETWFDRAHNSYLDYLSETGILGLLSYLGIFALLFWNLFAGKNVTNKAVSPRPGTAEPGFFQKGAIFALVSAYMVQNLAIFEVLPMYINFFLVIGFCCYYFYGRKEFIAAK